MIMIQVCVKNVEIIDISKHFLKMVRNSYEKYISILIIIDSRIYFTYVNDMMLILFEN